nr:NADH-quinone oxidoreductase subunit NuoE [Deinobacterium chartae]
MLRDIFARYPERGRRSALMPLLREVQNHFGYVSEPHIQEIADLLGITATEVKSVMSFYSTYHTVPTGKYHIQVCSTLSCALAGSDEMWDALVERLGVGPGEVTPDGRFSVQKVECLGSCGTAPVLQVNDAGYGYHECMTRRRLEEMLAAMREDRYPVDDTPMPVFVQEGRQTRADGAAVGAGWRSLSALTEAP